MNKMKSEFDSIEETTISLANIFNNQIATLQADTTSVETEPVIPQKTPEPAKTQRKKRKRGTELTLDD